MLILLAERTDRSHTVLIHLVLSCTDLLATAIPQAVLGYSVCKESSLTSQKLFSFNKMSFSLIFLTCTIPTVVKSKFQFLSELWCTFQFWMQIFIRSLFQRKYLRIEHGSNIHEKVLLRKLLLQKLNHPVQNRTKFYHTLFCSYIVLIIFIYLPSHLILQRIMA